jgi:hypothetical protein
MIMTLSARNAEGLPARRDASVMIIGDDDEHCVDRRRTQVPRRRGAVNADLV